MKCLVIQTSPERISAEPVTNEDGTPHVYATMAEARADLRANGYSYNRANQRYYIKGTEYRAYIVREDSEEYAEIMEEAEQQQAPEYVEPEHIQTVSGNKIYRSVDPVTGGNVFTVVGRDSWELAEARYFAQCNPAPEIIHDAEPVKHHDGMTEIERTASGAVSQLLEEYAATIGAASYEIDQDVWQAAYRVAAVEIIPEGQRPAGYTTATDDDRATVAAMVEAIAERTHAAEAIEDAREAWTGPDYYRIAYSDGGMDATNDGAIWYETAADLARDLRSAYESATDTHLPYAERIERHAYQRYELEAFLGDFLEEYDVAAIEAEATEYDPATGRTVWTPEAVRDLWTICERHELYSYSPAEDEPEPDEITQYMRRQAFGDYSHADAATREQMEAAALEFAAQEQTRPTVWQEAGARQARERYEADEATARDLVILQAAGAITAEDVDSYYQRHGWTPRKHHRN